MFLVEIWNNNLNRTSDPDFYISTQYSDYLDKPWQQGLINISGINYAVDTPHGGMVRAKFGTVEFLPTVICTDYIGIRISFNASILYTGVAFIKNRTRTALSFDLFSDVPNVQIDTEIDYTGGAHSLISIFQDYCDTQVPPWTLDSSLATTGLYVDFTATTGQLFADMLTSLCQTYAHYFVVDTDTETIFLREVTSGVGTTEVITGVQYMPSRYSFDIPPSKVTIGDETAYGDPYYFGKPITLQDFGGSDNLVRAELIRTLYTDNPEQFSLIMPMEYFANKDLNFIDKNNIQWTEDFVVFSGGVGETTFNMVMLNVSFDVRANRAILSGRIV